MPGDAHGHTPADEHLRFFTIGAGLAEPEQRGAVIGRHAVPAGEVELAERQPRLLLSVAGLLEQLEKFAVRHAKFYSTGISAF
ncbi:MAG: hypothetical protein MO853_09940 [Candidatus Protistobacter heckmanni]|nr:hypothetical protein [Candidatus Protistobacter heckmanni]